MNYSKLKGLVKSNIGLSPHPTIEANGNSESVLMKAAPINHVPAKSVPVNNVPARPVPVNHVPVKPVPVKAVPVKAVPTNHVSTNHVPTNHVPTVEYPNVQVVTSKEQVGVSDLKTLITKVEIDSSIDNNVLNCMSREDKLIYLASRGWRLNAEVRGHQVYDYAVKYINRKKQRIYLGKTEL